MLKNEKRCTRFVGVAAIAALLGCEDCRNRDNGLLGVEAGTLPALQASPSSSIPADDGPSLTGLDRRGWNLVLVSMPRGQVEVQPTYGRNLHLARGSVRGEGIYPTASTALDGSSEPKSVLCEAILQPLWIPVSFGMTPMLIARGQTPWSTHREPRGRYEVVPAATGGDGVDWRWVERPATVP